MGATIRHPVKTFQQQAIVGRIFAVSAAVPCAVDARRSVESVDRKAGIVGNGDIPQPRTCSCLDERVFFKGIPGFFDFGDIPQIVECNETAFSEHRHQGRKDLTEFSRLVVVASSEQKCFH